MGTRALIGIQQRSGKIKAIYCHSDGYPSCTADTLLKHYDGAGQRKKVQALIKLGYVSFLYDTVEESAEKAANKDVKPSTFAGPAEFFEAADRSTAEFVYFLHHEGVWIGTVVGYEPTWYPLPELIAKYPD